MVEHPAGCQDCRTAGQSLRRLPQRPGPRGGFFAARYLGRRRGRAFPRSNRAGLSHLQLGAIMARSVPAGGGSSVTEATTLIFPKKSIWEDLAKTKRET